MKKLLWQDQGSTLLMVIIMMVVLGALGTVMLSMTLMNTTMKYNDLRSKKSMYYAESGLEQVYALLTIEVDKALAYANSEAQTNVETLKTNLEDTFTDTDLTNDGVIGLDIDGDGNYDDFDGDGFNSNTDVEFYLTDSYTVYDQVLNTEAFQSASNAYFKKAYKDYFTSQFVPADFKTNIEGISTTGLITTSLSITWGGSVSDFADDNVYTLQDIKSVFTYKSSSGEELTEKEIIADIDINIPENYAMNITNNKFTVENNPIWQNALVSESVITFNNANSTIEGNIFAYGVMPSDTAARKDSAQFRGIELDGSSQANVTGDLISHSDIKTIGSNSSLRIYDGNVYCNSLITQSGADSSDIWTNSNSQVHTYDDIELNADGSTIIINGKYYGFSDGGSATTSHDNSSSILVNADTTSGIQLKIGDPSNGEPDVFVAGTAYINVEPDPSITSTHEWPYQTGESFSVKGNYFYAYTTPVSSGTYHDSIFEQTNYPFELIVEYKKDSDITYKDMLASDKSDYFYEKYLEDLNSGSPRFTLGSPSIFDIDSSEYGYSLGTSIGTLGGQSVVGEKYGDLTMYQRDIEPFIEKFNFYVHTTRLGNDGESFEAINYPYGVVETCVDFLSNINDIRIAESIITPSTDATEVIYVTDTTETVRIHDGSHESSDPAVVNISLDSSTSQMQGLIVTKGDIEIIGDFEFTGTIIAEGDIYINGSVDFNNSEDAQDYLATIIRPDAVLRNMFRDFGAEYGVYEVEELSSINLDRDIDENMLNTNYDQLIQVNNWKVQ